MKDLLMIMKTLKAGASNDAYPIYSPYLYSDGKSVSTCNTSTFVRIHLTKPLPFKGYVNIFILEEVLNLVGEDMTVEVIEPKGDEPEILRIRSGSYKTDLNLLQNLGMPDMEQPNFTKSIQLNEETLAVWRYALQYVGRESLSPLYIDKEGLCASDGYRIFINVTQHDLVGKLSLNKKIMNFLKEQYSIMADEKGNVNVGFSNGFAIFTTDSLDFYPYDRIRDFMNTTKTNVNLLCNIGLLRDCAEKVSPIFHGEAEQYCTITNLNKKMVVKAESKINGTAEVEVDSMSDTEFKLVFNLKNIKNTPFDFDCFINKERQDRLFLANSNGSFIGLMGAK